MAYSKKTLLSYGDILSKDTFYNEYILNKKSTYAISQAYNIERRLVSALKRFYGISTIKHTDRYKNIIPNENDNKYALQIFYGTCLGDAYLNFIRNSNVRFELKHGIAQLEWLEYKKKYLSEFLEFADTKESKQEKRTFKNSKTCYRYYSLCHTWLTEIYPLLYKNKHKYISQEILQKIDYIVLSVWILDDGTYNVWNDNYSLSVYRYNEEDVKLLQDWFINKLKLDCSMFEQEVTSDGYIKYNINFKKSATLILKPNIAKIIQDIPSMHYKIREPIKRDWSKKKKVANSNLQSKVVSS